MLSKLLFQKIHKQKLSKKVLNGAILYSETEISEGSVINPNILLITVYHKSKLKQNDLVNLALISLKY